ncbi:MAG: class I SAM-dependent methyltransferase [Ginsengibacter sp.]
MYSRFQLAKKYFHYYITAASGKGHGIHSPFVFDFVTNVLNDRNKSERSEEIEKLRNSLLQNNTSIDVEDFGAGSGIIKTSRRLVKQIASSSSKPQKYAMLIGRIAKYHNTKTIIELGTSFGISAAYIASANPMSAVFTLEGSESISNIAQNNFDKLSLRNINLIRGDFNDTLPGLLSKLSKIDLAFIDGNHRKLPVLKYFNQLLAKSTNSAVFIFDDIHWSYEMEEAWKEIQAHPGISVTIDLFFLGIVFFNKDFKVKQHFVIRF